MAIRIGRLLAAFVLLFCEGFQAFAGPSSEDMRNKNFTSINTELGFNEIGWNLGLRVGLLLTSRKTLEFDYMNAQSNTYGDNARVNEMKSALSLRSFLGNSFNLRIGAGYRIYKRRFFTSDFFGPIETTGRGRAESYGFDFGVGNLWTLGPIVLGAEWISLYLPLKATESTYSSTSGNVNDDANKKKLDDQNERVRIFFPKLMIGVSF